MNQTAAAKVEEFPGPRMRSFLSFLGLAGGVYIEADRQRKARLAGVDLAEPKGPLEEVLSQVGLDVPNLEMILAKVMGDTPEARRAAAAVIRSRDAAKLLQDFATRCAGGSSQATTTPPAGDSTSTSTNPTSESGTTTPPPDPTPQAPTAAPPATPPIFHPPQTYAAREPAAVPVDGSTSDALGSWFYSPTDPNLAYRPEYDPLGQGAPPGWRAAPVRKRPPPPPPRVPPNPAKTSSRRGWSLGNLPTRPRRADSPTATPHAAPKPRGPKRSDAATTTASASTTAPKSTSDAQVLKDFIEWAKAKIEALESRMDAELAATRRQLEEAIQRLARLERAYEALIASRRDAARASDTKVEPEAAVAQDVVEVEVAQEVVVEVEVEAADGEEDEEPGSEPQVVAENAELDPISEAVAADDMEVETEAPILDEGIEPETELTALNVPPTEDELNDPDERAETLDPQAIASDASALTDDATVDRILDDDAEEGPDAAVVEANATHVDLVPELEDDAAPSPAPAEASLIQLAQAQTQALLDAHQEQRQRELREVQGQLAAVNERIRQMEAVCPT